MSYQQKTSAVSLFTTFLVFAIYAAQMLPLYEAGRFEEADGAAFVGKAILALIVASIVVNIIATIFFNIAHAIITNTPKPSFLLDERDKAMELRGLRISFFIVSAAFCIALIALVFGQSLFIVFNLIIFSFAIGDATSNVLKLTASQWGF